MFMMGGEGMRSWCVLLTMFGWLVWHAWPGNRIDFAKRNSPNLPWNSDKNQNMYIGRKIELLFCRYYWITNYRSNFGVRSMQRFKLHYQSKNHQLTTCWRYWRSDQIGISSVNIRDTTRRVTLDIMLSCWTSLIQWMFLVYCWCSSIFFARI